MKDPDSAPKCATFLSHFPDPQDNVAKVFHGTICDYRKGLTLKPLVILVSVFFLCIYRNSKKQSNESKCSERPLNASFFYTGKNSTKATTIKPEEVVMAVACHFFRVTL